MVRLVKPIRTARKTFHRINVPSDGNPRRKNHAQNVEKFSCGVRLRASGRTGDRLVLASQVLLKEGVGCFQSSEGFSQVIPELRGLPRLILLLFGGIPNSP